MQATKNGNKNFECTLLKEKKKKMIIRIIS
jgi:hypothetical protein